MGMTGDTSTTDSNSIRQRILDLEGLPPFPATASQILSECQKPETNVRTVVQLVECEQAVSSKVIQMANSPMFGASRPIVSINHAIVLLGFNTVSQLAISIAAGSLFKNNDPQLAARQKQTFRQSLACAITARAMAAHVGTANPDEAFLCGVMHDVGKLVLFDVAPIEYCSILDGATEDNTTTEEQSTFGIDHAGVGKRCGVKWGFPSQINAAIEDHHRPMSETEQALSQVVLAGNYYSRRWMIGSNEPPHQAEVLEIENAINANEMASIQDLCKDQFESVVEICAA
jgi:putative nucleotidyltransferase with HDIG domain